MGTIHLANARGRNAQVTTETVASPVAVRLLDVDGRPVRAIRVLRGTLERDLDALAAKLGGRDKVAAALVDGDPEVDLESYGSLLGPTARVYLDPDRKMVTHVEEWELVKNPDGSEKERRPRRALPPNVASEVPLRWSGRLFRKPEIFNRFVFAQKLQITHTNGLTYDFLYAMAKELEDKDSMLLVGGGARSNEPLVFHRGGMPFRGFLEGRTEGEKYSLVLHLSNLELRRP
jgi:hypothetical protein